MRIEPVVERYDKNMKVTNKPTTKFIFRIPAEGDTPLVVN